MNGFRVARPFKTSVVIIAAVCSTAQMPPLSEQVRAGLDQIISARGVYVVEESAYKFVFPRTDVSVRSGRQRLSPVQAPQSWATFTPSMHHEGMMNGELVLLYLNIADEEVRKALTGVWERRRQLKVVSQ